MKISITKKINQDIDFSVTENLDDEVDLKLKCEELFEKFSKTCFFHKNLSSKVAQTKKTQKREIEEEMDSSDFIHKIANFLGDEEEQIEKIFATDFSNNPAILISADKISAYDALRLCLVSLVKGFNLKQVSYDQVKKIFLPMGFNNNNFHQAVFNLKKEILVDSKERKIKATNQLINKIISIYHQILKDLEGGN
ncbi:MAG: hypothetical protein HWN65_10165 [Candidatus Helarchaeota archaeon]|nr:hypothetical protein [Candidatus Helarchaeota archaeon]